MNKSAIEYITITMDYVNQRIDNFLITRLKGVPKTRVYRLLRKGEVRVNKKRIPPSYRLQAGDCVRLPPLRLPDNKPMTLKPSRSLAALLADRILYEDNYLFILNKPSGIPVHGGTGASMGVIEALRVMYPHLPHLELAHRLDLGTSGCLIIAKKRSILKELHELFRSGEIKKRYWLLTKGHWKEKEVRVNAPLQKNQLSSGERFVRVSTEGKSATTLFRVLKTFDHAEWVEATLLTGRTHQIRVHAQYSHHPIAGDDKYGDALFNKEIRAAGLKRMFLHAHQVEFTLSSLNHSIKVEAPLDHDLTACLTCLT